MKATLLLTSLAALMLSGPSALVVALPEPNPTSRETSGTAPLQTAMGRIESVADSQDAAIAPTPVEAATSIAARQIPSYSGQIGHYDRGRLFSDFLFNHDGQVVYLNVFFADAPIGNPNAVSYGEDWFSLWTDCDRQTISRAPSAANCIGVSINVNPAGQPGIIWGYNQGFQYLKGYWLVTAHPGMHQGQLSLTLSGAPAQ